MTKDKTCCIAIVLTFDGMDFEVSANLPRQVGDIPHCKVKAAMDRAVGMLHQALFQAALDVTRGVQNDAH